MAYSTSKDEIIKSSNSSLALSDGFFPCSIVGYMVHEKQPFKEGDSPFHAIRFAMQLVDDEGHNKVVQTADMRVSLAEKSSLFKQLAGWSKASSPEDLWARLEKAGFMDPNTGNLNFDKFLGVNLGLMVKMVASKKDASKQYPEFTFAGSKKDAHTIDTGDYATEGKPVPIWISDYIEDDKIVDTTALDGFEWKRYERSEDAESEASKPNRKSFSKVEESANAAKPAATKAPVAPAAPVAPTAPAAKIPERLTIRKRTPAPTTEINDDNGELPF